MKISMQKEIAVYIVRIGIGSDVEIFLVKQTDELARGLASFDKEFRKLAGKDTAIQITTGKWYSLNVREYGWTEDETSIEGKAYPQDTISAIVYLSARASTILGKVINHEISYELGNNNYPAMGRLQERVDGGKLLGFDNLIVSPSDPFYVQYGTGDNGRAVSFTSVIEERISSGDIEVVDLNLSDKAEAQLANKEVEVVDIALTKDDKFTTAPINLFSKETVAPPAHERGYIKARALWYGGELLCMTTTCSTFNLMERVVEDLHLIEEISNSVVLYKFVEDLNKYAYIVKFEGKYYELCGGYLLEKNASPAVVERVIRQRVKQLK